VKLITECTFNVKPLYEGKEKKDLFISGIFMEAEMRNKNGRIYPLRILEKEVNRYIKEYVNTHRAIGELNHPDGPIVNPANASHIITELKQVKNSFQGKAKILNTPMGNVVKGLYEGGVQLGVSSRGMGSLKTLKDGVNEVQDDYILNTVDIVHEPSAPNAFVNGIMEGVEWVYENGVLTSREIDCYLKEVQHTSKKNKEEAKLKVFEDFLKNLKV